MAEISKIILPDGTTYSIKDSFARSLQAQAGTAVINQIAYTEVDDNTLYFFPIGTAAEEVVIEDNIEPEEPE